MSDQINHPPHYNSHPSGIECIEVTQHMNFCLGNAMKYLWRAGLKGEDPRVDLSKAIWYINQEITRWEKEHAHRQDRREDSGDQHDAERQDPSPRADLLPLSREGSDPQGNESVPGREEEKGPVSGQDNSKGWRWDDDHPERVRPDQDPTGETKPYAEQTRINEARTAAVAERLRRLEQITMKADVHDAFKKARELRERGANYRDLFGDGAYGPE